MNTVELKRFAQGARRKLLEQVGSKFSFVLTTDSPELREKTQQIKQLREELNRTTKEQLIEKVAYTWFNRMMALRFMDANDYQPLGIRIITPKDGYTSPELLDEAKRGNTPSELNVKKQKVYDLLDGKIPSTNPQNEAFKELLIAACNHLNTVFPFLFEKINDYTELLLPDDLTSDFSIVTDIRDGMPSEDCKNVEIIGWLYQFYISEEKERLINTKKKYKPNEIAPVTQLFTPKWIVQYMVDNTLGQLWYELSPRTNILNDLEYYIGPKNDNIIQKRELKSPEEITFFDPCVGSGHILCYAFDIFYKIYQEEGYNESEIPELIITRNLFGIDIDERAAQLAGFALMMKGQQFNRRFLKKGIIPNITSFHSIDSHPKFRNAEIIGSLININQDEVEKINVEKDSIFSEKQMQLKKEASFLAKRYDILVTNPPYLNSSYMEGELKQYVEKEYDIAKPDLFACFLFQSTNLVKNNGLIGFICPYVWMFIKSYEELRKYILNETTISTLIQLEYNAFEPACVPVCTFVLRNELINSYLGSYIRLSSFTGSENQPTQTLKAIKNHDCGWFYYANQQEFEEIPSLRFAYWIKTNLRNIFKEGKIIEDFAIVRQGFQTGNNDRFLRLWYEPAIKYCGFGIESTDTFHSNSFKYAPHNKGGEFRKWYGNNEYVVKFDKVNYELLKNEGNKLPSRNLYFKNSITWTALSSSNFGARENGIGFTFSAKGACAFPMTPQIGGIVLGLLNSKISSNILEFFCPTLDFNVGDIRQIPFSEKLFSSSEFLVNKVRQNVAISRADWDAKENSWDFSINPLLGINDTGELDLEETCDCLIQNWKTQFLLLHKNEEELNLSFIEIYGLHEDLYHSVSLEDISILQDEIDRKILKKTNKSLFRNPNTKLVENYHEISLPFISKEILAQFISYSVGCVFGRYSLEKEGLILANQGETLQDYLQKIGKTYDKCIFVPDKDNIIPLLDDEWFEDDIVGRFNRFLKVTFGEKNYNKNLVFIEEQIGKDIRKYFTKDFYPDHIKRYKKRPIYWMFTSPKGSFSVLIYMHRYTPDTVSNVLNKYLKEFIGKLKTRREYLQQVQVSGSASEKTKAIKETDSIVKMLVELQEYERDVLYPLATERIGIDLDDGVLVNYNKFGKAVKEVSGLNDPATKKKVMQFDWIDTTQIR